MSDVIDRCPSGTVWKPSCKRRSCPFCGPRWARDWRRVLEQNFAELGVQVVTIAITAPGRDVLPWDDHYCRQVLGRPEGHRHEGRRGCRIEGAALSLWCETLGWRWTKLREAARQATKRELKQLGIAGPAWILSRVWEPQKRGAPHLHLVLPFGSKADQMAAWVFLRHLRRLAPEYGFGRVQQRDRGQGPDLQPLSAQEAARYLASYLTGRTSKKNSIRENIADPRLPRSLLWLTPKLTRRTLVTMRTLRRARHLWFSLEGGCEPPVFMTWEDGARTIVAFRRVYPKRAGPLADELDAGELVQVARLADEHEERARLRPLFYESEKLRQRGLTIGKWAFQRTASAAVAA